jgi:hypothetical protein
MAGGVRAAVDVLREVSLTTDVDDEGLETVRKLVASYELGRTSRDLSVCKDTFPACGTEATAVKLSPINSNVREV